MKNLFICCTAIVLSLCLLNTANAYHPVSSKTEQSLGGIYPEWPEINFGSGARAELARKGEYLARAGDCLACHTNTKHHGKPFAGGLPLDTPFGRFYSVNITPDEETGIGHWKLKDFMGAMRHGHRPDGSNLFPVFPYLYFTKVSDNDLRAIWAYLRMVPAVKQENRKEGAPFPFSWRPGISAWNILFFDDKQYEYNGTKSAEWNRGAYLVQGLGHCGMCHTPLNMFGAPKNKYFLTGGFVDGYWAPNITQYAFKNVSTEEIANVFVKDELTLKAGRVAGPMAEVNHDSLQYLTKADQQSIAVYLKSVESDDLLSLHPQQAALFRMTLGRRVYKSACVTCHQQGVEGAPVIGEAASWEYRAKQGLPALYRHTINGYNLMPTKGGCVTCSKTDIKAAVDYILSESLSSEQMELLRNPGVQSKPTIIHGENVYKESCAVCHEQGKLGAQKLGDKQAWAPLLKKDMDSLIQNTIHGLNNMPARGGCKECTNAEIIAAVKYMVQKAAPDSDYSLW